MKKINLLSIFAFVVFYFFSLNTAGTIKLKWDAPGDPSIAGYKIYYGTSSQHYTKEINAGNVTNYTIRSLENCTAYYLALKSYNDSGIESIEYSNEVSGMPKPIIQSVFPASGEQGENLTITIIGENFDEGVRPEFENHDIKVIDCMQISCNEIEVDIIIKGGDGEKPAELGNGAVSVINSDNVTGSLAAAFEVKINTNFLDINNDGIINGLDLAFLALHFGTQEGDNDYEPSVDFNGDGWIDGNDLATLSSYFGENIN